MKHGRTAKPSEEDKIAKGRRLAASYLTQRDGLAEEIATMIVEGLEPEDVNALIAEANTATLEKTADKTATKGAALVATDDDGPAVDYTDVEVLANNEFFVPLVYDTVEQSKIKNDAEKQYKANKQAIIALMKTAKTMRVAVSEVKLTVYRGHARWIDEIKLLENGVSIDIINKCWSDTPYDDVQITVPKPAKS